MQRFQRTFAAAIATAALLGSAAFSAHAQPQAPAAAPAHAASANAAHGHRAPADFAKFHTERMEHLKTVLQIQPGQQAAWDKYVKAITPEQRAKPQGERPDLRKLTTPERLDLAQKLRKERTAKAEQRDQATRSFYASLNPSQQKAFDAISAQRHGKPGMHKAGHGKRFDGPRGPHHGHGPAVHPASHPGAPVAPAA